jgi:hypothetical protein
MGCILCLRETDIKYFPLDITIPLGSVAYLLAADIVSSLPSAASAMTVSR